MWAPFANSVAVAGTFNDWKPESAPLTLEGNGVWSTDVPGAKAGDEYKFVLESPFRSGPFWKNDPWARSLTNSVGNGIVAEHDYEWHDTGYSTPSWNELVIYELHVASFLFDPQSANGRGNFDTVITKLDYLRDLGVSAIQLTAHPTSFPAIFPGATTLRTSSRSKRATVGRMDCAVWSTGPTRTASR